MKKQFGKLFIIFGVILCIFALVGCDLIFVDNPDPEKNPAEETSSETVESSENPNEESSEEPVEETTEETWQNGPIEAEGNELIFELTDYLKSITAIGIEPYSLTFEGKINYVKEYGAQPIHVVFNSESNYYFVCGYINPTHERDESRYCCVYEYTWVRYRNENEIQEYYNGEKIAVAFQINEAFSKDDIGMNSMETPDVEYYQLYEVDFVDGLNVKAPIVFNESFIYLDKTDKDTVYHTNIFYLDWKVFHCAQFEGEYYIIDALGTIYSDGGRSDAYLSRKYGEYYQDVIGIMDEEKGIAFFNENAINLYCLIPIGDFADKVLK